MSKEHHAFSIGFNYAFNFVSFWKIFFKGATSSHLPSFSQIIKPQSQISNHIVMTTSLEREKG